MRQGVREEARMDIKPFKKAITGTSVVLAMTASLVFPQSATILKITGPSRIQKQEGKPSPSADIGRAGVFKRLLPRKRQSGSRTFDRLRPNAEARALRAQRVWTAATAGGQSFGTGGGDISELEPNDRIAQGVSLPVNVFGEISFDGDLDFFAFRALEGQLVTVEAFAARLRGSQLIADIALFDSSGLLIASDVGDENNDPIIRYRSSRDETLIAGVADADDFGGFRFDYTLNITRGVDVSEAEPNDSSSQSLAEVPVTVFGDINGRSDLDFFSFSAVAGQTLIVDVDAAVLRSRLDAIINVLDPQSGVEFFSNDQYDGDDPRFNIVLPYTGRYAVGIGAFNSASSGFYRLNLSLVAGSGAPTITEVTRIAKKTLEVRGTGLSNFAVVEVNGVARNTTIINSTTLRARVKIRFGDVVTVSNPPDDRRSNPLLMQ
jgi:hypothetical protein